MNNSTFIKLITFGLLLHLLTYSQDLVLARHISSEKYDRNISLIRSIEGNQNQLSKFILKRRVPNKEYVDQNLKNIRHLCELYTRYKELLKRDFALTTSQRHMVVKNYEIIKNALKTTLQENLLNVQLVYKSMYEIALKKSEMKFEHDTLFGMREPISFKWG